MNPMAVVQKTVVSNPNTGGSIVTVVAPPTAAPAPSIQKTYPQSHRRTRLETAAAIGIVPATHMTSAPPPPIGSNSPQQMSAACQLPSASTIGRPGVPGKCTPERPRAKTTQRVGPTLGGTSKNSGRMFAGRQPVRSASTRIWTMMPIVAATPTRSVRLGFARSAGIHPPLQGCRRAVACALDRRRRDAADARAQVEDDTLAHLRGHPFEDVGAQQRQFVGQRGGRRANEQRRPHQPFRHRARSERLADDARVAVEDAEFERAARAAQPPQHLGDQLRAAARRGSRRPLRSTRHRPVGPIRMPGVGPHETRIQIACYGSQLQKRVTVVGMSRRTISTVEAPKAIGPYAQAVAVAAERFVFCSGQIPIDPKTGEMVGAGDVRVQTARVLDNLRAVLEASGSAFDEIVKTTIFLADLQDFAAVNEVYARYFSQLLPARSTIQAAGLPKGALVEIDAIATVSG